jgi:hypothetical protein
MRFLGRLERPFMPAIAAELLGQKRQKPVFGPLPAPRPPIKAKSNPRISIPRVSGEATGQQGRRRGPAGAARGRLVV